MKKLFLISTVALSMAIVSCNNQQKEEEVPIEEAIEDMQEAVEDTTVVDAEAAAEVVEETAEEAAH